MPIGMRVEGNIKFPQNERVPTASIENITYLERQSFLRGEKDIMRREAKESSPLVSVLAGDVKSS